MRRIWLVTKALARTLRALFYRGITRRIFLYKRASPASSSARDAVKAVVSSCKLGSMEPPASSLPAPLDDLRILRMPAVLEVVGIRKSALWEWVAAGRFPRPIQLGPRAVGWRIEDIRAWRDALPGSKSF